MLSICVHNKKTLTYSIKTADEALEKLDSENKEGSYVGCPGLFPVAATVPYIGQTYLW